MKYTLNLPFPPSANRYWRNYRGQMVKSAEARDYQSRAYFRARAEDVEIINGSVALELHLYRPQKRGDLDNRLKVLIDSLQGVCYENDSQVVEIHAFLNDDKRNPRVEVTVWER